MPDQPIELGLRRPGSAENPPLVQLCEQLLDLLARYAKDKESLDAVTFRQRVQHYRERVPAGGDAREVARYASEVTDLCERFYSREAASETERQQEIGALIETLTSAIGKLAGESSSVNAELTRHAERFKRLEDVEEIRELKRRITEEVSALDRFVAEKQEQDEAYFSRLNKRIEVLQTRLSETEEKAALDPLTQVANRGTFDRTIRRWLERGSPFVLVLLDIDDFKRINDTFGHLVGDRVLLACARTLTSSTRGGDLVARYGGEEFALLLAGASLVQAEERVRQVLERIATCRYDFEHDGQPTSLQYTTSGGLAEAGPGDTPDTIIQRADAGLYEAKSRGKNRAVARKASLLSRLRPKGQRPSPN